MNVLGALERRIEQLIEGLFTRWAGHRVQPFEIRRQVLREMERGAAREPRTLVLPNVYDVELNPEDLAPYGDGPTALTKELLDALHARAGDLGGRFDGPLRIEITARDGVRRGEVRVAARVHPVETGMETRPDAPPASRSGGAPHLRVVVGAAGDGRRDFPLEQPVTTIGRDAGHTIVLADPSVSRTHARLERGPAGAAIVDLGSTNGTILNGRLLRNDRAPLRGGDRLQIGTSVFEFWEPAGRPPDPP